MNALTFRKALLAMMACLALFAAGCGEDKNETAKKQSLEQNAAQAKEEVQAASNEVNVDKSADPAVQKAQRELAEKAAKQKAEAIKKGTTATPENRSDTKCKSFSYFEKIGTAGHNCRAAIKLIKSEGDGWVKLPANPTKVGGGFRCQRISEPATQIKITCIDIVGTVTFSLAGKS